MMNLAIFERMPRPGRDAGTWGYLANAFVLAPYRNQGIGALLLAALVADADDHGYVRVVLRPSERSIPFYQRAGFTPDGGFLIRHAPRPSACGYSSEAASARIRATIRSASSSPIGTKSSMVSPRSDE
jgi:GNAT superfamily N-acetyltransferase